RFSMPYEAWQQLQEVQADDSLEGSELAARIEEILSTESTAEAQEYAERVKEAQTILDEGERTRAFLDAAMLRDEMAFTIPMTWGARMYAGAEHLSGLHPRPSPEGFYYKTLTVSD